MDEARSGPQTGNIAATVILNAVIYLNSLFLLPAIGVSQYVYTCDHYPNCDQGIFTAAAVLLWIIVLGFPIASTVVSVVFLKRKKFGAFYAPIVGIIAMNALFYAASALQQSGTGS